MGMVPTFSRSRDIPETIYLPPQRSVISSCLALSCPVLSCSLVLLLERDHKDLGRVPFTPNQS
jgi:hypothetical protein